MKNKKGKIFFQRYIRKVHIPSVLFFCVTLSILIYVTMKLIIPTHLTVDDGRHFHRVLRAMIFTHGILLAPGILLSMLYPFYYLNLLKSDKRWIPLEIYCFFSTIQTIVVLDLLSNI